MRGPNNLKLMGNAVPAPVTSIPVMGNFFQTLGVPPMLSRLFLPEEYLQGQPATQLRPRRASRIDPWSSCGTTESPERARFLQTMRPERGRGVTL